MYLYENIIMGRKSTKEQFIFKSLDVHDNKFDYSKVEYFGNKTKVIIICPKHGEFLQRPNDHLTGYGCKKCQYEKTSFENKLTKEEFINNAIKIHGNRFDYSLVEYKGYENKVNIICNKHGVFIQSPHGHLGGNGCAFCRESRGERKVSEILIKNNILFEREVTFSNLKDKSNLFYDFYLPKYKLFIEYHGIQHFKSINFFGGSDGLVRRKKHDIIKYKYAVDNGYKILWINNIPIKYLDNLLTDKFKEISIL